MLLLLIKQDGLFITGQKPITGSQAKHNIEMVYKNIKLTSSGMDYKAVLGVVNRSFDFDGVKTKKNDSRAVIENL